MNIFISFIVFACIGGFCGALFGVLFGVCASIFRNGPPVALAIEQSWWWFAIAGLCMGLAWAAGKQTDMKKVTMERVRN
jgi:hypothetical protein